MVGYDDSQLGAPDLEEEEEEEEEEVEEGAAQPDNADFGRRRDRGGAMVRADYDKLLLESAVDEFERNFADRLQR